MTKELWSLAKKYTGEIAAVTAWALAQALLYAVWLLLCGRFILLLSRKGEWRETIPAAALAACFVMLKQAAGYILAARRADCQNAFKREFRIEVFEKLFYLGPGFTDKKETGELVDTIWEKIEWISYYLFYYIPASVMIVLFSAASAAVWAFVQPAVACIIFLGGCLVTALPPLFQRFLKEGGEKEWDSRDSFYSACLDGLQGIVTLKAFHANARHREKINRLSEENRKSVMGNLLVTTLNSRAIELAISAAEILADVTGVRYFSQGAIGAAPLLALFLFMCAWADGARMMFEAWLRGNKGAAAFESALEILNEECPYSLAKKNDGLAESIQDAGEAESYGGQNSGAARTKAAGSRTKQDAGRKCSAADAVCNGDIELSRVTFTYKDAASAAVDNLTLLMKKGTQTALVGSSGSGKSTVIRLLFGFYRPQAGEIKIDGKLLDAQSVKAFQQSMTVIWQDCHIFHMTCMDNIRIARPAATDEEVFDAAKKANIHERILRLPEGYQTVIGDGGHAFSGGEKQRIALARAFLRDAPVLILDEATSSLDRKNELEIQACIRSLSEGKTVLTVAHRLDTIRGADQICVMEDGKIVERGTHRELMERGKRYAELMGIVL